MHRLKAISNLVLIAIALLPLFFHGQVGAQTAAMQSEVERVTNAFINETNLLRQCNKRWFTYKQGTLGDSPTVTEYTDLSINVISLPGSSADSLNKIEYTAQARVKYKAERDWVSDKNGARWTDWRPGDSRGAAWMMLVVQKRGGTAKILERSWQPFFVPVKCEMIPKGN